MKYENFEKAEKLVKEITDKTELLTALRKEGVFITIYTPDERYCSGSRYIADIHPHNPVSNFVNAGNNLITAMQIQVSDEINRLKAELEKL